MFFVVILIMKIWQKPHKTHDGFEALGKIYGLDYHGKGFAKTVVKKMHMKQIISVFDRFVEIWNTKV